MTQVPPSLDDAFAALAHPARRAVIERLARGPASVGELAAPHGMALPSFLQHLGVLEARGLIRTRKEGRVRTCEIVAEPLEQMAGWLDSQRDVWTARLDRFDAYLLTLKSEEENE